MGLAFLNSGLYESNVSVSIYNCVLLSVVFCVSIYNCVDGELRLRGKVPWGRKTRLQSVCNHQILRSLLSVWFRLLNSSVNPNCYCQSSNPVNQSQDWPALLGLSAPLHQRNPVLNQRRGDWAWRKKLMAASPSCKRQCFNLHHLARKCPCWG